MRCEKRFHFPDVGDEEASFSTGKRSLGFSFKDMK
jgi:hypothetical protein